MTYVSYGTISLGDFQKFNKTKNQKSPGRAQKSIKLKIAQQRHSFSSKRIFAEEKHLPKTKNQKMVNLPRTKN